MSGLCKDHVAGGLRAMFVKNPAENREICQEFTKFGNHLRNTTCQVIILKLLKIIILHEEIILAINQRSII